jgi:hypothetical protein
MKQFSDLEHSLQERLKELKCLYGISKLVEQYDDIDQIAQGTVNLIPKSWQYPEITCANIQINGQQFMTSNYLLTSWRQEAEIRLDTHLIGKIEVCYLKEMKEIDEGPFLKEERWLINAIAERFGRIFERIQIRLQLECERAALANKNIALQEILEQVQYEKRKVAEGLEFKIDKLIMPYLLQLEKTVTPEQQKYIQLIRSNLEKISEFKNNQSPNIIGSLSPTEIQICNMVSNGFSTKEIAQIRHLSPATIHRHRENIRKKLELTNKKINLSAYLSKKPII